jgi:hypothetical protein
MHRSFPHGKLDALPDAAPPEPVQLPSKLDILKWQAGLRTKALTIIKANPQGLSNYNDALVIMHWCLSEWFSNNIPAIRLFCIRTMQVPLPPNLVGPKTCTDPECNRQPGSCRGNRLEVLTTGTYNSTNTSRESLWPTPAEIGEWDLLLEQPDGDDGVDQHVDAMLDAGPTITPTLGEGGSSAAQMASIVRGSGGGFTIPTPLGGLHTRFNTTTSTSSDSGIGSMGYADPTYYAEDDANDDGYTTKLDTTTHKHTCIIPQDLALMKLVLPHHKMETHWGPHALEVVLPYDLALTTHLYLEYAYPLLNPDGILTHMFLRPNRHEPMQAEHMSMLWQAMQELCEAPWQPFSPTAFRDIHIMDAVQHLAEATANTGFNLHGDAAVMQNTMGPVWERSYCKDGRYFNEMVKGTVDRMTKWRIEQLTALHEASVMQQWLSDEQHMVDGDGDGVGGVYVDGAASPISVTDLTNTAATVADPTFIQLPSKLAFNPDLD